MRGVRRFTDLRAWQACDAYKKAIYKLIDSAVYGNDWKRRVQIEESVSGPPDHIAEGFGRFNPPDFARFTVMARSSLMESQSQLRDAVDSVMPDGHASVESPHGPSAWQSAPRTKNLERRTQNPEPNLNANLNANQAPNLNTNRAPRTEKGEQPI